MNFTADCMSHKDFYMRHLVRRAAGDTKATRSTCERLLERKISTQPFREEVPRKTRPMNRDQASVCMCTIGWKRVCMHVRVWVGSAGGRRGSCNSVTGVKMYNNTHVPIVTILWQ